MPLWWFLGLTLGHTLGGSAGRQQATLSKTILEVLMDFLYVLPLGLVYGEVLDGLAGLLSRGNVLVRWHPSTKVAIPRSGFPESTAY